MTPPIYQAVIGYTLGGGPPDPPDLTEFRLVQELRFYLDGVLRKELMVDPGLLGQSTNHNFSDQINSFAAFGAAPPFTRLQFGSFQFQLNSWEYPYTFSTYRLGEGQFSLPFWNFTSPLNVQPFSGKIDEAVVWQFALNSQAVADRASSNPSLSPTLSNLWHPLDDTYSRTGISYPAPRPRPISTQGASDTSYPAYFGNVEANAYNTEFFSLGGYFDEDAPLVPHSDGSLNFVAYNGSGGTQLDQATGLVNGEVPVGLARGVPLLSSLSSQGANPELYDLFPNPLQKTGYHPATHFGGRSLEFWCQTEQDALDMRVPVWERGSEVFPYDYYISEWKTPTKIFLMRPEFSTNMLYFLPDGSLRWGAHFEEGPGTGTAFDTLVWAGPINDNQPHHIAMTSRIYRVPLSFVLPS